MSRCLCAISPAKRWKSTDMDRYEDSGRPRDKSYLERGLPDYLRTSLEAMKKSWEIEDSGGTDLHWDICWCELNADINSAETDQVISSEQAWYLRRKYLRMVEEDDF